MKALDLPVAVTVFLVVVSNSGGHIGDCGLNEKFERGKCQPCPKCSVGFGLTATCGFGYGMGLECAPCPENTYNQDPEAWRCLPCTDCSLYGRVHRYRCRPQLNAECGPCIQGFYDAHRASGMTTPCAPCRRRTRDAECKRWRRLTAAKAEVVTAAAKVNADENDSPPRHSGALIAAVATLGVVLVVVLVAFVYFCVRYKKAKRPGTRVRRSRCRTRSDAGQETSSYSGLHNRNASGESGLEQAHVLGCNDAQPSSSLHNDLSPSPSVLSLIKQKIKTRLARRRDEIQGRGLVQHQLDADSVVSSNAATKDSSSSSDGQLSSSASDIDDPEMQSNDSASLLDARRVKCRDGTWRSTASSLTLSPPLSLARIHRAIPVSPSMPADDDSTPEPPAEAPPTRRNLVPPAAVPRAPAVPSAPPASLDHVDEETTPLRIDMDAGSVSLATNYSQASTVPIRSWVPDPTRDGAAHAPEPARRGARSLSGRSEVDETPDFGLTPCGSVNSRVRSDMPSSSVAEFPTLPMVHSQGPRLAAPATVCSAGLENTQLKETHTPQPRGSQAQAHIPARLPPQPPALPHTPPVAQAHRNAMWLDSDQDIFNAEIDVDFICKMVKAFDAQTYVSALRLAADKQVEELNYEVREQVSLAMDSRGGLPGDRNFLHLALRLGVQENVARSLRGMMDVFTHLTVQRVTIGQLLRTLRAMGRPDVVSLVSNAVLHAGFADPLRHGDDDFGDTAAADENLTWPQQEQGSPTVETPKPFPFPVQEQACFA